MGLRWTWWARARAAILVAGLFLGSRGVATGKSMTLAWDRNAEEDLAGYKVYIGTFPGNYTQTIDVGHATSVTIPDLLPGETYFIAVTAYDIFANESGHSAEIRATIPKAPPPAPAPATTLATPEPALPEPPREAKTPELPGIIHPNPSASQAASGGSSSASAGSSATGEGGSPTLMSRLLDSVRSVFGFGGGERTSPSASSAPPPVGPAESRSASEAPTQPVASASPVASQAASRAGGLTSETIAALRLRGARERELEADRLRSYQRSLALTRELGNHERLRELQDAIATVQRLAPR